MDHARVAKDVIGYVGGSDNITAAAHCATRLRLVLADLDKVDQKGIGPVANCLNINRGKDRKAHV